MRASSAAPHYFDPQLISIVEGQSSGLFLDGGLTPHNNPSLAALMMAVLPPFGLNWALRPNQLTVVSIGTGSFRPTLSVREARRSGAIGLAIKALGAQIADAETLILTLMGWLGAVTAPVPINSELGNVGGLTPPFGKLFRFFRYDLQLDLDWLERECEMALSEAHVIRLRRMDEPANLPLAYELGCRAAPRLVDGIALCGDPRSVR